MCLTPATNQRFRRLQPYLSLRTLPLTKNPTLATTTLPRRLQPSAYNIVADGYFWGDLSCFEALINPFFSFIFPILFCFSVVYVM